MGTPPPGGAEWLQGALGKPPPSECILAGPERPPQKRTSRFPVKSHRTTSITLSRGAWCTLAASATPWASLIASVDLHGPLSILVFFHPPVRNSASAGVLWGVDVGLDQGSSPEEGHLPMPLARDGVKRQITEALQRMYMLTNPKGCLCDL